MANTKKKKNTDLLLITENKFFKEIITKTLISVKSKKNINLFVLFCSLFHKMTSFYLIYEPFILL